MSGSGKKTKAKAKKTAGNKRKTAAEDSGRPQRVPRLLHSRGKREECPPRPPLRIDVPHSPESLLDQIFAVIDRDCARLEFEMAPDYGDIQAAFQGKITALLDDADEEDKAKIANGETVKRRDSTLVRINARAARSKIKYEEVPHAWTTVAPASVWTSRTEHPLDEYHGFLVHRCVNHALVELTSRVLGDEQGTTHYTHELRIRFDLKDTPQTLQVIYHLHRDYFNAITNGPLCKAEGRTRGSGQKTWLDELVPDLSDLSGVESKVRKVMWVSFTEPITKIKHYDDLLILRRALRLHGGERDRLTEEPMWRFAVCQLSKHMRHTVLQHTCWCHQVAPPRLRLLQLAQHPSSAKDADDAAGYLSQFFPINDPSTETEFGYGYSDDDSDAVVDPRTITP